jgi:hypothetical protein
MSSLLHNLTSIGSIMTPHATMLSYSSPENIKDLRDQGALISMMWLEESSKCKVKTSQSPYMPQSEFTVVDESVVPEGALETLTIESDKVNIIVRAIQPRLLLVLVGGKGPKTKGLDFRVKAEKKGDPRYPTAPLRLSRRVTFNLSESEELSDSREDSPHANFLEQSADAPEKPKARSTPPKDSLPKEQITPNKDQTPASTVSATPTTPQTQPTTPSKSSGSPPNQLVEQALDVQNSKGRSQLDEDLKLGLLHIQRKKIDYATEHIRRDFAAKGFVMPHGDIIP